MVWIFLGKSTSTFGIIYDMKTGTQMGIQTITLDLHYSQSDVFTSGTVILEFMSSHVP